MNKKLKRSKNNSSESKNISSKSRFLQKTLKTLTSEKEDNIEPKIFVYFQAWQRYYLGHQWSYKSKYAHFVTLSNPYTIVTLAQHYMNQIFRFHGTQVEIISDRDPVCVSIFWKELFDLYVFLISSNPLYSVFPTSLLPFYFFLSPYSKNYCDIIWK